MAFSVGDEVVWFSIDAVRPSDLFVWFGHGKIDEVQRDGYVCTPHGTQSPRFVAADAVFSRHDDARKAARERLERLKAEWNRAINAQLKSL